MKKVGISIGSFQSRYGDLEALDIAARIGADAVDFNTCGKRHDCSEPESIYSKSDDDIGEYFTRVGERAKELGVEISQTHGRVAGFRRDAEFNKLVVQNARLDCLAAKALGAPVVVMHGANSFRMGIDTPPQLMRDTNFEMFTSVLPFAKQYGVQIATETFGNVEAYNCADFFGNIDEFAATYERICAVEDFADWFVTCVDTGHSNKAMPYNNPSAADVIRRLGSSVKVLHLNDNDSVTDQHKPPLTGNLDWQDILDALDEIGYDGVYNMELKLKHFGIELMEETAAFSIKIMRNLLDQRK